MNLLKIFISYSHKDESVKEELVNNLSSLKEEGLITIWEDRQILPSQKWNDEIGSHLETSDIAIFLVSPDFLSSKYINEIEVPNVLKKYNDGKIEVIPIIIRECDFGSRLELSQFQALPKDTRPIDLWDNRNEVWRNTINSLGKMVARIQGIDHQPGLSYFNLEAEKTKLVFLYNAQEAASKELKKQFFPLTMTNDVQLFDIHEDVRSGDKVEAVKKACKEADYILCYVTPDFWQSCYFYLNPYLTSANTQKVIPLKIKKTFYEDTPLSRLRSYPSDGRWASDWNSLNDAFVDIVNNMRNLLK